MKQRYAMLDGIRGFAFLNMVVYHAVWDLVYLFQCNWSWFQSPAASLWQQLICSTFIMLSGFCSDLGRRSYRTPLIVFGAGLLVSMVTYFIMPQSVIWFGVLTLLGTCLLLQKWFGIQLERCPAWLGFGMNFGLFFITRHVNDGYLGIGSFRMITLPESLYRNWVTTYFGFPMPGFYSTDYFPLLPWVFLFFAGYYLFKFCMKYRIIHVFLPSRCRWMEWLGKHTLLFYLLHQPIIYGFLYCIVQ